MSTKTKLEIESCNSGETEKFGEALGALLKGGEVIDLSSDIGGGKTTLTRGVVRGTGSKSHVSSPTFKICNVYDTNRVKIYHFDFYRLADPGLIKYEIEEVISDPNAVVIVEWSDIVSGVLPEDRIQIKMSNTGELRRRIDVEFSGKYNYLSELEKACN